MVIRMQRTLAYILVFSISTSLFLGFLVGNAGNYSSNNVQLFIQSDPSVVSNSTSLSNVYINATTNLTSNLTCENLYIDNNVTLYTDGYNIICFGNFTSYGTIITGLANNSGDDYQNALSYPNSLGGSGGGDSYTNSISTFTTAGATDAFAGSDIMNGNGQAGSTGHVPTLFTDSLLRTWYNNSIQQYLTGGGGAGGMGYYGGNDHGANGAYGIFIQAQTMVSSGIIMANGQNTSDIATDLTHGGGGGGAIIIAYGSGGYTINGGIYSNGSSVGPNQYDYYYSGGTGGNGNIILYDYGNTPVITNSSVFHAANYYSVSVSETGLQQDMLWTVTLSGSGITPVSNESYLPTINFLVPNGTYNLHISKVGGYNASFTNETVSVSGHAVGINVIFNKLSMVQIIGRNFIYTDLMGSVIIVGVVGVMIFLKPNRGGR